MGKTSRGERLRLARINAGFRSAAAAAKALAVATSTYNSHERAQMPGGRDFGPDEALLYGRRFRVDEAWLLTGKGANPALSAGAWSDHVESDAILQDATSEPTVPVVGYVGAGAETQFYPAGELDRVPAPAGSGNRTAALEIRGKSIGTMFDRWIAYFDDVRSPVTDDMVGKLCVVGLADGRTLVKKLARKNGSVVLVSEDGSQIDGGGIEWDALVKSLSPR